MEVDESTAEWTTQYKGKTYYFCAPGCKEYFEADPEKYLHGMESGSGKPGEPQGHDE
jgi:Cu+-exporting ATPase